jgi:UDP-N-acetylmuramoyl-L-alanyl-D-glutamate--2,6-diaminopimelate ligase
MRLDSLFPEARGDGGGIEATTVTADSRSVVPGAVFVALRGTKSDGLAFAAEAAAKGAVAVVTEAEDVPGLPEHVARIRVADARRSLALAASALFPGRPDTIVAVTGTSGKTSVADFTRQIFAACGREAASLGTIGVVRASGAVYGSLTTPDPVTLHRTLDTLAAEGVTHLAMEASSHGLEQRRLDGVELAAAAFTNLGRDHLDYHETMEAYLRAKLRLFDTLLPKGRPAVINMDGAEAEAVLATCRRLRHPVVSVGRKGRDLTLIDIRRQGFDQSMRLRFGGAVFDVLLPLAGAFQAENALTAAGLALATGEEPGPVFAALSHLVGVRGRLERVATHKGALIVVDYAHKPEALMQVLDTLREAAGGKVVCVFGCGGDRDRGKRPIMGRIAAEKADRVIVTDDNPRSEAPAAIRAEILAAAPGAVEIGDRAEAIRAAVKGLGPGDILVVAGKGHETGQISGDRTLPFSDHDSILAAVAEDSR